MSEDYLKRFRWWKLIITSLTVLLLLVIIFAITIGTAQIPASTVLDTFIGKLPFLNNLIGRPSVTPVEEAIILQIRMPRIIAGVLVGISLSLAGVALQGLFRNPMADPYVTGVSAGAALGATIAIAFGLNVTYIGSSVIPFAAFLFAFATIFTVYSIARVGPRLPITTLLLAGVAITSILSTFISFIQIVAGEQLHMIVFWLMGGLAARNWEHVTIVLPFMLVGSIIIYAFSRDLNMMMFGDEQAQHLGVEVERLKKVILLSTSLITAAAVSISGLIGFVGLVVPHMMRILIGSDHRILIPSSALAGAIFLVLSDTLARTIIIPAEIPVGIVTALIGGPFFIYLLHKKKGGYMPQ